MIATYPLNWPLGYKRTASRINSPFKQGFEKSQQFLKDEIRRMGATGLIVSSNIPVRKDGMFYADYMGRVLDDPGVAIFFNYKGRDVTMVCDQYAKVWENVYALGKSIESLRGMERWGVSELLERAFRGFNELPPPATTVKKTIWDVLGIAAKPPTKGDVITAFRAQAQILHPDKPGTGDAEKYAELQAAYEEALKYYPVYD